MSHPLTMKLLIFLVCSFYFASVSSDNDIYKVFDKTSCAFPFKYKGKAYNDCTTDGDNGDIPWCALTNDYKGLITYCYDFRNTTIQCLPVFQMPNGKNYTNCDFLSTTAKYKQCKTNHPTIKYRYCTDALGSKKKVSLKRRDDCDANYAKLAVDHTMCYGPSPYATVVPFTATEKQDLLDMHNSYRSAVPSRYMFKLYWDDELAKLAQAHANLCAFEHDLAANRLSPKYNWKNGQNIVMSSEIRSTPASLIDMMLGSEKENFHHGGPCAPGDGTCLHYTQAMISNLTRVGCAQTHCVYPDRIERFITCNYIQSQYEDNYQTPYVQSDTPAVDCPEKTQDGLCDCGDKICDYDKGEYLNPATCKCKKSDHKRSIDKRSVSGDGSDLEPRQEVYSAGKNNLPPRSKRNAIYDDPELEPEQILYSAGKNNLPSRSKRRLKPINKHRVEKRSFPKKLKQPNQQ